MSHFVVYVALSPDHCNETLTREQHRRLAAGDSEAAHDAVTPLLAPYHEFECTGMADRYVVEVDQTEEVRAEFENGKERRYRDPSGELHDPYDNAFYRDPTPEEEEHGSGRGKTFMGSGFNSGGLSWTSKDWGDGRGYRAKVHFIPEGWEEIEVPRPEVENFADWASGYYGREFVMEGAAPDLEGKNKYGWIVVRSINGKRPLKLAADDGKPTGKFEVVKVIDRTNPNSKWDWWSIGGRWSGIFSEEGAQGNPNAPAMAQDLPRDGNVIRLADWDFEAKLAKATERYGRYYDDLHAAIAGLEAPIRWSEITPKHTTDGRTDWDAARTEHSGQPAIQAMREVMAFDATPEQIAGFYKGRIISQFDDPEEWLGDRDTVALQKAASTVLPFAMVDEDGWHAKGDMGMFASVGNKDDDWARKALDRLRAMDPDTYLVAVDCHV